MPRKANDRKDVATLDEAHDVVTSSDRLVKELTISTDASIGVIGIRCPTTEVYRVVDELYALAQSAGTDFRLHTMDSGWQRFATIDPNDTRAPAFDSLEPQESDRSSIPVGKAFEALFLAGANNGAATILPADGFFVMLDLYFSFNEPATQTSIRKFAQRSLANEQRLFLVIPDTADIPDAIAPLMHIVEFGYPTRAELRESLFSVLDSIEDETSKLELTEDEVRLIVSNGQGMTAGAFETAVAMALTTYVHENDAIDGIGAYEIMRSIRDYKTQLLRKTQVLELQTEVHEDQIGGLELFKEWMHQRKATYTDAAKASGVTPSRGSLVVGPPGTGKSLVAKAAGNILQLPVIRFDVGKVFGAYMGQSEQSMRSVLSMIDAMAPCVLMLDEIDKGFAGSMGGGGNDSGTTQRVFGTFLTWMQERDQKNRPVFLIPTANRVSGLPPELLRKGRIDEIFAVNLPTTDDREAIARIHLAKRKVELDDGDVKAVARITENLVGAEIEALIEDALVLSLQAEDGFSFELVEQARANLKPMSDTRKDEFDAMKTWATNNARPAGRDHATIAASPKPPASAAKRGRIKTKPKQRE